MKTHDAVVFDLHSSDPLAMGPACPTDGGHTRKTRHYPRNRARRLCPAAALLATLLLAACASPGPRPTRPPASPSAAPALDRESVGANEVTLRAIGLVGTPYQWGGNTPQGGFDCSGLVHFVFADAIGRQIPRTTAQLAQMPAPHVRRTELRTGDLVFFASEANPDHVGIYVGEGRFVHAPNSGGTVRLDHLDNPYWTRHYTGALRPLATSPAPASPP